MDRLKLLTSLAAFLAAPWLLGKPGLARLGLGLGEKPARLTLPEKSVKRRG